MDEKHEALDTLVATNSTRRFWLLPSAVAFEETGAA